MAEELMQSLLAISTKEERLRAYVVLRSFPYDYTIAKVPQQST